MSTLTITYNGYTFTAAGHTWFERKARNQSDLPHTAPFQAAVTYSVRQTFLEDTFADNQAQYALLLAALASGRGTLTIKDENGVTLFSPTVSVEENSLPAQWGQNMTEVTVGFLSIENLSQAWTGNDAVFTPPGNGAAAIALRNVTDFKENIRADRYSTLVANRRETNGTVMLAGKIHVDPTHDLPTQQAYLVAQKALIDGIIDVPSGQLVFNTFVQPVKVESVGAELKDGTMTLEWSLSATYLRFPGNNFVECDYKFDQKDSREKKERVTTVQGTVRSHDEASGRAKVAALDTAFAAGAAGRIKRGGSVSARFLSGTDSSGGTDTFVELDFALDYREPLPGTASFSLTQTDRRDVRSGLIRRTYGGKANASTSAAALAQARICGGGKSPIQVEATETIQTNDLEGADYFVEVSFSYEYLIRGTWQYAEVTSASQVAVVGNGTQTISGNALAVDETTALALARSFKLTGDNVPFLQDTRESAQRIASSDFTAAAGDGAGLAATATQHAKVDFSYQYFLPGPAGGAMQYAERTSEDFYTREITSETSGTCYAAAAATANTLIDALWSAMLAVSGARKIKREKTRQFQTNNGAGTGIYTGTQFNLSTAVAMGANGDDILEAACSLETLFSVQKTVITEIPYGTPYVQTNVGQTAGSQTMSGSITAITRATAVAWARAKYLSSGYVEAPREHVHQVFYRMTGTLIQAYRMEFTYATRFATMAFDVGTTS